MNKAMKYARKELVKLGCDIVLEDARSVIIRLSDGTNFTVSTRTQMQTIRRVIDRERRAFRGETGETLAVHPECETYPKMQDAEHFATAHFSSRLKLMRRQGLDPSEVTGALLEPEIVRRHKSNGRWIYCAGRVGVVVAPPEHGVYSLVTLLWATDELWAQNPRPERVRFHG